MAYKILCVTHGEEQGVGHYRQRNPHTFLQNKYPEFSFDYTVSLETIDNEKLKEYAAVHFIMFLDRDVFKVEGIADRLKRLGVKSILDLDDYWYVLPGNQQHNTYKHLKPHERAKLCIKEADFITCPVSTLAYQIEKIRGETNDIGIIPNAIDPSESQFEIKENPSELYRFGWAGGSRHLEDIGMLKQAMQLHAMDNEMRNECQIVLAGYTNEQHVSIPITKNGVTKYVQHLIPNNKTTWAEYEKVLTDNYRLLKNVPNYIVFLKQFSSMQSGQINKMPYKRVWSKKVTEYAQCYNEMDVCLIPLMDNTFNKCKSQLKLIEAGFFKKPVIISDVAPYNLNGFLLDEVNCIVSDWVHWHEDMRFAYENKERMKEIGENLYQSVKMDFHLDVVSETRKQLYEEWLT